MPGKIKAFAPADLLILQLTSLVLLSTETSEASSYHWIFPQRGDLWAKLSGTSSPLRV